MNLVRAYIKDINKKEINNYENYSVTVSASKKNINKLKENSQNALIRQSDYDVLSQRYDELMEDCSEKDDENNELKLQLDEKTAEIDELNKEIEIKDAEISALNEEIEEKNNLIDEINAAE